MNTQPCTVCARDPRRMNSEVAECSHVACPHRRSGWCAVSVAPRDPFPKNTEADPVPLDRDPELISN